jgi:hypothetical protein
MQHIAAEGWGGWVGGVGRPFVAKKSVWVDIYRTWSTYTYTRIDAMTSHRGRYLYHFTPARLVRARNRRKGRLLELGAGVPCEFLAFSCNL